ncbi:MAG: holo-[acyl-carrier-protein] synthase [Planctomycetaceae bacterium]|nr:holo-[acyl-carrier-protein] synthase [Planctomycetaceae bacterium]
MNVIGLGTDIIECLRIAKMIEKHGELFLNRVYTKNEIAYCSSRKGANQSYAGRWAVKEAVLKAMGTGWSRGIRWKDIEVVTDLSGKPHIAIHGVAEEICHELGITDVLISLSHCRSHATATAIAVGTPLGD